MAEVVSVFDATERKAAGYVEAQKLRWFYHRNRGVGGLHCK